MRARGGGGMPFLLRTISSSLAGQQAIEVTKTTPDHDQPLFLIVSHCCEAADLDGVAHVSNPSSERKNKYLPTRQAASSEWPTP